MRVTALALNSNTRDFGTSRYSDPCEALEHACREGGPLDAMQTTQELAAAQTAARSAPTRSNLDEQSP
jgi:hypothetical protein